MIQNILINSKEVIMSIFTILASKRTKIIKNMYHCKNRQERNLKELNPLRVKVQNNGLDTLAIFTSIL